MYLHLLNDKQKEAFLALATKVVLADDKVPASEHRRFTGIRHELGEHIRAAPSGIYTDVVDHCFDTPRSRVITAFELLVVAFVDCHYHENERAILEELKVNFGIDDEEWDHLNDMAERMSDIYGEADELIDGLEK